MRVLVLTGNYFRDNLNVGDLAIYASLFEMLPDSATVTFVSEAPEAVRQIAPRVRCVPPPAASPARGKDHWERLTREADLVVASGGSYFSSLFKAQAQDVLDGLAVAQQAGLPTAVLGAAFERLDDPDLTRQAVRVLNQVVTLWARDLGSARFLAAIGVPWSRISCHADPALRMCLAYPEQDPGNVLGINLRDSPYYNPMTDTFRQAIRDGLGGFLAETAPELRALPVSLHGPSDEGAILASCPQARRIHAPRPEKLLAHIADCRVVVSGSHHAAVFALGLGIPVVMVGASAHYLRKLRSLEPFFGDAARVINLASPAASAEIAEALRDLWQSPGARRADLRRVARRHVEQGQACIGPLIRATKAALSN